MIFREAIVERDAARWVVLVGNGMRRSVAMNGAQGAVRPIGNCDVHGRAGLRGFYIIHNACWKEGCEKDMNNVWKENN